MGDFYSKRLERKIEMKKLNIENNIRSFFDQFLMSNKLIFAKLKNTINNEQNSILGDLDELKRNTELYVGEEMIYNGNLNKKNDYPINDSYMRKQKLNKK